MKTIIMNSLLAITILLCTNISAQYIASKKTISDELMKNTFIFEGKIISYKHDFTIRRNEHNHIDYMSYLVEVKKVIKGNIKTGTINLLIANVPTSDGQIGLPGEGLYFCFAEAPKKDSSVANTNAKSLEYDCGESMANGELKKDDHDNLIGYFPTIAEFYAYISANYGVKMEQ